MPLLLLVLFFLALTTGTAMVMLIIRRTRQRPAEVPVRRPRVVNGEWTNPFRNLAHLRRPSCWLAIKTRNLRSVQTALALHNAKPCFWREGLANAERLFIAPPVHGWIIVVGSDLPDPSEDVDACFRFVVGQSRKQIGRA